jgi:Sulfotransferase domain
LQGWSAEMQLPNTSEHGSVGKADARKPNFFIVGAPRCGTGSLWTYLKGHPEIYMSTPKELYFFDTDLRENSESLPSLEQYLAVFSAAGKKKKIGEATPSYLRSEHAPKAIKAFSPGAQIIIMLRNPIDVMYSLHRSALDGLEPITDFEVALEADASRTGRELVGYREFTQFPEQVERYFDLFGRKNVHTIIYDDLKKSSAAVYESTLRFLGVKLGFAPAFTVMGANRYVRNLPLQRILVRPPRAVHVIGRTLVPRGLRVQIRARLLNLNTVVRARPPLDPELRRRLQREFEAKVERLSKLLGRDLSGWCRE